MQKKNFGNARLTNQTEQVKRKNVTRLKSAHELV